MKTKVLISCAVSVQLISTFVFTYASSRFSHGKDHINLIASFIPGEAGLSPTWSRPRFLCREADDDDDDLFCLFVLRLNVPVNIFSVMS